MDASTNMVVRYVLGVIYICICVYMRGCVSAVLLYVLVLQVDVFGENVAYRLKEDGCAVMHPQPAFHFVDFGDDAAAFGDYTAVFVRVRTKMSDDNLDGCIVCLGGASCYVCAVFINEFNIGIGVPGGFVYGFGMTVQCCKGRKLSRSAFHRHVPMHD